MEVVERKKRLKKGYFLVLVFIGMVIDGNFTKIESWINKFFVQ